jgi:Holliday junction resolvasome RuvABC endonuclease subunit
MPRRRSHLRILAIDPGTRELGYALLDGRQLVYHGVLTFGMAESITVRCRTVRLAIGRLLDELTPGLFAVEQTFFPNASKPKVANALVSTLTALARQRGIEAVSISSNTIKCHVTGFGRSGKRAIAAAVIARYPELRTYLTKGTKRQRRFHANRFDAIAVALTAMEGHNGTAV